MAAESANPQFPSAQWGDLKVRFQAVPIPACLPATFVVVFARRGDGFVLADIPERGWITPSGRLEPGETALEAAIRETWEEIGARLEAPREIGHYTLTDPEGVTRCAVAFVGRVRLFGNIPPGSESRGARTATLEVLPSLYWRWDALLEAMFRYAASFDSS
jgi:8-oxo-dGTP pyrophosphatase MutT (NUDIX family)